MKYKCPYHETKKGAWMDCNCNKGIPEKELQNVKFVGKTIKLLKQPMVIAQKYMKSVNVVGWL